MPDIKVKGIIKMNFICDIDKCNNIGTKYFKFHIMHANNYIYYCYCKTCIDNLQIKSTLSDVPIDKKEYSKYINSRILK